MSTDPVDGPPSFRKATARDALATAIWLFERGERVDMHAVATRLDIGRSTLYRWVGDREKLMDQVILASIGHIWDDARAGARGEGVERMLDATRRFMQGSADYEPLTSFAQREPNLALRVLLDPEGLVATALARSMFEETAAVAPDVVASEETFGVIAVAATALLWAHVAAGREPKIDTTVDIMRAILTSHASSEAPADR